MITRVEDPTAPSAQGVEAAQVAVSKQIDGSGEVQMTHDDMSVIRGEGGPMPVR
jgi:hypothetical protein